MDDLVAAHDRQQRGMQDVDDLAHNLHAAYRLTERCRAIVATAKDCPSDNLNLVLVGSRTDFEAAIQLTTDFELLKLRLPGCTRLPR